MTIHLEFKSTLSLKKVSRVIHFPLRFLEKGLTRSDLVKSHFLLLVRIQVHGLTETDRTPEVNFILVVGQKRLKNIVLTLPYPTQNNL